MEKCKIVNICLLTTNVIAIGVGIYYAVKASEQERKVADAEQKTVEAVRNIDEFKTKYQWAIGDTDAKKCVEYAKQREKNSSGNVSGWTLAKQSWDSTTSDKDISENIKKAIQEPTSKEGKYMLDSLQACVFTCLALQQRNAV